jgi:hypothetical protein
MAYSATNAPVGFSETWELDCSQPIWLPGVPGTTYERGNALVKTAIGATANAGLFVEASDSSAAPLAYVAKETVISGASEAGFPYDSAGGGGINPSAMANDSALARSMIPAQLIRGGSVRVHNVPFANYTGDEVLAAYTAATPSITLTTALGADDDPNGGLVYIYSGPGAGQWNHIVDYANATKIATLARKFEVAPTTASSIIILEGEGSSVGGVGHLGRCDLAGVATVDVSDGADDGDLIVVFDSAARVLDAFHRGYLPVALYSQFV